MQQVKGAKSESGVGDHDVKLKIYMTRTTGNFILSRQRIVLELEVRMKASRFAGT